ncbi:pleckstrin homology domain-containing family A member 8 [Belonocnema kinseyi]|uniref:pleckstrin homology domain-containing family A member 8 n=1 Tax=Belonocnema kinseyi TaxID=2817044 RepID=UPI00143DE1C3|nr:pleckstrin homology domain-containing family A member 8 [Belonocnema kinseyi]
MRNAKMSVTISNRTRKQEREQDRTAFPEVTNGKINTEKFLAASQQVVGLIEKFGKLFAPVKYDMQQNIDKLNTKYNSDKESHCTLQDMILSEKIAGESVTATEALLWLRRGLHMIQLFFEKIIQDYKTGNITEDLVASLKKSYKESLEPFHGWMAQQLFGLLARMIPARTQLMEILTNGHEEKEEEILNDMDELTKGLKKNVIALHIFYDLHNLNSNNRV